jgi:valyl-tRNA synthetase
VGSATEPLESRWITARLAATAAAVHKSLADYRFDEAASAIYQFFWGDFCDWYLEIVKLRLNFAPEDDLEATKNALITLLSTFESALRLLSPFMPFITEEIWQAFWPQLGLEAPAKSIALTRYPKVDDCRVNDEAVGGMKRVQGFIQAIRARRKEIDVPEKEFVSLVAFFDARSDVGSTNKAINNVYLENLDIIIRLARVTTIERKDHDFRLATPELGWTQSITGPSFAILYERQIDIPAERERLTRDLAKYEKGLQAADRQLSNVSFMAKAPAHIVEGLRKQSTETRAQYEKTKAALEALPSV